jgi:hypothetical protein
MGNDEQKLKNIEDRLSVVEQYHKNLTPKGDLKTVFSVVPLLVLTTTLGLLLGYNFYKVFKSK